MESLISEFKETVIITQKISAAYLLPVELIERIIIFVAEISNSPGSKDYDSHVAKIRDNLLSLSRIERIGKSWMLCAEKKLCERVVLTKANSEGLRMLAEVQKGDRRLVQIQVLYLYQVGDFGKESQQGHNSGSDITNLTTLLPLLPQLNSFYLASRFCDWQQIHEILLEKQIELTTLWLHLCHDDDEEEGGPDDLAMDLISIAGIPSLVDLSVTSPNAAIILNQGFFDDVPLNNLKFLNLEGSEEEEIFPLLHLFASLLELTIFSAYDENLLSYFPTTLRTLKMRFTHTLAQQLRQARDTPFYLQHIHLNSRYSSNHQLSFLSILPPSVESITLENVSVEHLFTALKELNNSRGLKRLEISNTSWIGPMGEVQQLSCDGIDRECERLGIELV